MTQKDKQQFGIWMDSAQATIVGREASGIVVILATEKNKGQASNSERTLQQKFFKEIMGHMQNVAELHITGTGKEQEQLAAYLADTPQYKHTATHQSTTTKMSDEKLVAYFEEQFS